MNSLQFLRTRFAWEYAALGAALAVALFARARFGITGLWWALGQYLPMGPIGGPLF